MKRRNKGVCILINGVFFSGSSAVVDFCRGLEKSHQFPGEFTDFRSAGLVGDVVESKNCPRYRELVRKYVQAHRSISYLFPQNSLKQLSVKLHSGLPRLPSCVLLTLSRLLPNFFLRHASLRCLDSFSDAIDKSFSNEDILDEAIAWKDYLLSCVGNRCEYLILDQPIYLTRHLDIWPKVFAPCRLIVVVRDPRDQIADMFNQGKIFNDFHRCGTNGISDIFGNDLNGAIQYHLKRLKIQLERIVLLKKVLNKEQLLVFSFEWFVLDFADAATVVLNFIKNGNNLADWKQEKSSFSVNESRENIGIYRRFPEITRQVEAFEGIMGYYRQLAE